MSGTILASSDYDSIRAKLGLPLGNTSDDLPDNVIETIGLLTVAETMVKTLVTDWAAIVAAANADTNYLKAAVVALCGALAVRRLEMLHSQSFKLSEYSETAYKVKWDVLRDELLLECRKYLLRISTHTRVRSPLMLVSGPTSSASNWPTLVDQWYAKMTPHVLEWLSGTNGLLKYGWENQP